MRNYKLFSGVLVLFLFVLSNCYAGSYNINSKIRYMASFTEKKYEFIPPEKPVKFPVEITAWPGEFQEGPDTIDIYLELTNSTKALQKNVTADVLVELNTGKIIDSNGETDVEKSKKIAKYSKYFSGKFVIKQIAPGGNYKVNLKRILLGKLMSSYIDKNENVWEVKTTVRIQSRSTTRFLPIGFYGM